MSKKITSVEELVKIGKECEKLIELRKKWEDVDLLNKIQVKVGISTKSFEGKKIADQVGIAIIDFIKEKKLDNVVVYQTEFLGYSGELPSLEIIIPDKGQVVFGNVTVEEGLNIVERYLLNTDEIAEFLVDNDGNKKCNH